MNSDTRAWIQEAIALCSTAKEKGIGLLLRNDDLEIVVCSVTDAGSVAALGEALACGYIHSDEEE